MQDFVCKKFGDLIVLSILSNFTPSPEAVEKEKYAIVRRS